MTDGALDVERIHSDGCRRRHVVIPKLRSNYVLLPVACAMIFIGAWIDKGLGMISGGLFLASASCDRIRTHGPGNHYHLGVYATGFLVLTILYKLATTVKGRSERLMP